MQILHICSKALHYSIPTAVNVTEHSISKGKNLFSIYGFLFLVYCSHRVLLSREWCEVMWFGPDPSVCVLLTELSHIAISMATGAVAVATASSQSVLQLDVWAVVAWVTMWRSRQVSLTFIKVTPARPPSVLFFLCVSPNLHLLPPTSTTTTTTTVSKYTLWSGNGL